MWVTPFIYAYKIYAAETFVYLESVYFIVKLNQSWLVSSTLGLRRPLLACGVHSWLVASTLGLWRSLLACGVNSWLAASTLGLRRPLLACGVHSLLVTSTLPFDNKRRWLLLIGIVTASMSADELFLIGGFVMFH